MLTVSKWWGQNLNSGTETILLNLCRVCVVLVFEGGWGLSFEPQKYHRKDSSHKTDSSVRQPQPSSFGWCGSAGLDLRGWLTPLLTLSPRSGGNGSLLPRKGKGLWGLRTVGRMSEGNEKRTQPIESPF